MFNQLSDRLANSFNKLRGIKQLSDNNIKDSLSEVRKALLEADVALPVVKDFLEQVRTQAIGQEVVKKTTAGDTLIKIVQDQLIETLGATQAELNLKAAAPIVFLVAGLQGSGKTTTVAKLTHWLKQTHNKKVAITSADIYRPAAIDQLETLAKQVDAHFIPSHAKEKPLKIVERALDESKKQFMDVLIIDTAGRLHIDDDLMEELKQVSHACNPTETLLVLDSMAGQDAAHIAKNFDDALPLTGVILTKTDGDARGGAALSMRMITGKPIKFIGTGEQIDKLEPFHPDRIASRILGMGDIVSLVEEAQRKIDHKQAAKMAKKVKKGHRFDFNDFLNQLNQMKSMGGMQSILTKIPGMAKLPQAAKGMMDDKLMIKMEAIISSMTANERHFPALLNGSRKRRIAKGSGTTLQDVAKLLKQFTQMQKMMKRFKGNKMMKQMKQLQERFPGGLDGLGGFPKE